MAAERDSWLDLYWAATYGTARERFRLGEAPGPPPSWSGPGARWALVTAHNPGGLRAPDAENRRADRALRALLLERHLPFERALNGDDEWREPSLLVRELGLRAARALGEQFGQLAVVAGVGVRAALVPCGRGSQAPLRRGWATLI